MPGNMRLVEERKYHSSVHCT